MAPSAYCRRGPRTHCAADAQEAHDNVDHFCMIWHAVSDLFLGFEQASFGELEGIVEIEDGGDTGRAQETNENSQPGLLDLEYESVCMTMTPGTDSE